jgi:archaellum biogenesis ATPase FlaH
MFVTSWGRFERKFNNILEDLNRHGSLIDQEANAVNIAEAKKMREDIRTWREESQSQLSSEETEQGAKQFEAIASWLKINESDQLTIFDSISSEVTEYQETCGWILQNPKVSSWFQNKPDTPALWLQGSAGTGKSVLCTQLVKFMKASKIFVVHHFCTYLYASSTAYEQILKSLILQLARKDGDLVAHVYEAYVLEKKSPTATALEQLFQTLLEIMSNQPTQAEYTWVIIDGLDECEPDKQTRLIRLINQITSKPSLPGSTVCKFLTSSRSPSNALQNLRRRQTVSLTDEKTSLKGAIGQYVRERLRSLDTRLRQLGIGQAEVEEIRNVIVKKADGASFDPVRSTDNPLTLSRHVSLRSACYGLPREQYFL